MCGIFGLIRKGGVSPTDHELLYAISRNLEHRGPDGSGHIETPQSLIGMHRLSIMDVEHGAQPFWSEDSRIGVVGNGEIYNSKELARELKQRGHKLTTGSDMEVIPHLYEEYGLDFPKKLRGMFALAVLDQSKRELILVRDRLGEKPISYVHSADRFVFASEQNALLRAGVVEPRLSQQGLYEYLLHGFTPEPNSIIVGISKVPAGSILRLQIDSMEITVSKYWDLLDYLGDNKPDPEELLAQIENAVVATTQSDVPVGIALSGGIDSSLVAHFAQKARPDLHAFSIGYNGTSSDESDLAIKHAQNLGIKYTVTHLNTHEVGSTFAELCSARDEPISDIAGPALAAVARVARENGVPVLLNGIGGDEWFWGYDWVRKLGAFAYGNSLAASESQKEYSLLNLIPPRTPAGLAQWLETAGGLRTEHAIKKYVKKWGNEHESPIALYQFQPGYPKINHTILRLCGQSVLETPPTRYLPNDSKVIAGNYMSALCDTYLRVNSLAQTDRLGMHYSVEMRTPLVDYKLAEYVMSTRMRGDGFLSSSPKAELRGAAASVLSEEILNRPKKGFVPPVRDWIRSIWKANEDAVLNPAFLLSSGLLDSKTLITELSNPTFKTGRVNQIAQRLITLELWLINNSSPK